MQKNVRKQLGIAGPRPSAKPRIHKAAQKGEAGKIRAKHAHGTSHTRTVSHHARTHTREQTHRRTEILSDRGAQTKVPQLHERHAQAMETHARALERDARRANIGGHGFVIPPAWHAGEVDHRFRKQILEFGGLIP